MIHSKATTLSITDKNGDITMTTRLPQITSLLRPHNIEYSRKTIRDTNEIIQDIPENGYLDYEVFQSAEPIDVKLHYHSDLEARMITTGRGIFTIPVGDNTIMLQVTAGDYIVIPSRMVHSFTAPGNFAAIRFFTNHEGYIAHYVDMVI